MTKKILICDDSAFMRNIIKNILSNYGYDVIGEASNGLEAVKKYIETKPDLVFMDITMPELDGLGALKRIIDYNPKAEIIMCSAMGHNAFIEEAIGYGAKGFIIKPFQTEQVINASK